jgi:aspartate/methionine/tyrosine aminotransferase
VIESFFLRKLLARTGLARFVPAVGRVLVGGEDYLRYYSDRTLAVPLDRLAEPALLPDVHTPDSINLALWAPWCEFAARGVAGQRAAPAWGDVDLRTELAVQLHLDYGVEYEPDDEMLITHGATGAFGAAIDAFVNPGDRVVLFDPTSPIFPVGLAHRRACVRWVRTWSDAGRVRFPMDAFATAMRGAKLLVFADPVNPTGNVFAPEDLEQIAFWTRKHDVLIFQDASFDRWRSEPAMGRLASLPAAEGRVLTCGSFAKSHGLTAARVGWLAGYRHLVRPCFAASVLSTPFVPAMCQQAALHALRTGEAAMKQMQSELNARREFVRDRLREMGLDPWPTTAGFFVWVPVPDGERGQAFAQRLLNETGVLVNPGHVFGPSGESFVRISFATDEGRLREGLSRLAEFMAATGFAAGRDATPNEDKSSAAMAHQSEV